VHIEQWERDTGQIFLINSLQFEAHIKKQHDDFAAEKENEKMLRVSSVTVNITTAPQDRQLLSNLSPLLLEI